MPIRTINGNAMHYHVSGQGEAIIFIHPPLLTSANFNYQIADLSNDFKVITFDIRGHGRSAPSETPLDYTLIVEDIKQLMNELGIEKAYLCGYSSGGSIVLEAMLTYPERVIGGIMISAMSEVSDWKLRSRIWLGQLLTHWKAKRIMNAAISAGNADSLPTFANLTRTAKHGSVRNWMQYYRYSILYNCTEWVHTIRTPVLLIYGQKDTGFYRYASMLHHKIPDSRLFFCKGVGHQIPTKAHAAMNGLIRYWIDYLRSREQESTEPAQPISPDLSWMAAQTPASEHEELPPQ
ncbi:alpha/beta fold hydrolase [Paenibacillus sp. J2TS4]|uniref:alpha/beta fold hydrolase n=1 Tax=Paenibacillus sp. J2TS4 TaxID=2807194 RepID=UPI001AFCE86E|nr:alpha/beta hydrolase [Paenibacillus sp. J2TS4]GIP35893.1 hydrolase [Paenibacillus sp. J2TS4]